MEDLSSLLYLKFNEGTGSTTTKNYGSYGSSNYTVAGGSWTTDGKYGNAYTFDGSGYITTDSLKSDEFINNFTMMAWVKAADTIFLPTSVSNSGNVGTSKTFRFVFGAEAGHETTPYKSDNNAGAGVSVGTNGVFVTAHSKSFFPALAYSNKNLGTDWHHIAVVFNEKIPTIYIDGVKNQTSAITTAPSQIIFPSKEIGGGNKTYGNFKGSLDEVKIFGRALSATEIAQQYNAYEGCGTRFRMCQIPDNAALWRPENGTVEQTWNGAVVIALV